MQQGLSQRALAKAANVDFGSMSRIETGVQGVGKETIERIAAALHVSLGVLYSEPEVVEAAALRMRRVRILTLKQVANWPGNLDEEGADDRALYVDLGRVSAQCFALRIEDDANAPVLQTGDEAIFDADRIPKFGNIVVAQDLKGTVYIGRFRYNRQDSEHALFDVIPYDPLYPAGLDTRQNRLIYRGTLTEIRRYR